MADETERVEYLYEGDVSSLRQATNQALNLLRQYSDSMRRATESGTFNASQRSMSSLNASINRITRDTEKLQTRMSGIADVKLPTGSEASSSINQMLQTLTSQLQRLGSTDAITSKTLRGLKTDLDSARNSVQATTPQINNLIASEQRFQSMLTTVSQRATQVRNVMDNMKGRIAGTFEPLLARMRSLTSGFNTISSKIQSFRDKANTAFNRTSMLLSTVASAFRRTSTSADGADASIKRVTNSHRSLKSTIDRLFNSFKKETKAIKDEEDSLEDKNAELSESKDAHGDLSSILGILGQKFSSETSKVKSFSSVFKSLGSITGSLKKAFKALTGISLGDWLSQATTEAINFIENLNLFKVAMGDSIDKGLEFVDTMQEIYGMDPSNLYRYSGYFYQLTDAIDMSSKASSTLSLSLTKASNDIASLFNAPIDQVVENLASGMQGMSRAVRKYGMDIRATTLQQTALKYGLTDQVETMSETNRMALRYITMMEQVENATSQTTKAIDGTTEVLGDFARNIETPANQLRILKEQMSQLGRAIGNFILVPVAKAMSYINGFVMALRTAINFVGTLAGVLDTGNVQDAADSVDSIGDAATDAQKKMKQLTAPFDELNVLQEQTESGAFEDVLDPALEKAIANMELNLENIRMKANDVRDAILSFFGFKVDASDIISWDSSQFEQNLIAKFPNWTQTIQAAFNNWDSIVKGFKKVFSSLGQVLTKIGSKLSDFFGIFINNDSVSSFIENLGTSLDKLSTWISSNSDLLANIAIAFGAITTALSILGPIMGPIIAFFATYGSTLSGVLGPLLQYVAIAGAVIAAIALMYQNSEAFRTSLTDLFSSFGTGLLNMWGAFSTMASTMWNDLLELFETQVKPTFASLGDALAPVLDTISSLWTNVSDMITSAMGSVTNVWETSMKPAVESILEGIRSLCAIFQQLWEEFVGPVLGYIGDGLSKLWSETLLPIYEKFSSIFYGVIELIMALWNNVLAPLVSWIISSLGPSFTNIFKDMWGVIQQVCNDIGNIIDGLLTIFDGIIDFLVGVFTGDWERAWKGLVNVFVGVGNTLISVFETVVNFIIELVNQLISAIYNALVGVINTILSTVEGIADLIGWDLNLTIAARTPQIPYVSIPRIPEMATGGVVTSPTYALIGEGAYDEAVIPLGDSPQMEELVERIADAVDKPDKGGGTPVEVRVFIGDKEWDAFTYKSAEKGKKLVGAQPITTGG